MSENENGVATEKATETQNTEEITEAVETQSPATEKGIDEAASEENVEVSAEDNAEESIPDDEQEISYHAVEKEGVVTAIWEMQGRKHLRTLAPRSNEGKKILSLFETAV